MKYKEDRNDYARINAWWAKIVPANSLRTKIVQHISVNGPSSAYDIAKSIYERPSDGYASVLRNLKELDGDKILKMTRSESMKGVKRNLYTFSEFIGVPCAWAYAGTAFDFKKTLEIHGQFFERSEGLKTYQIIWDELGPDLCIKMARQSFFEIIHGVNDSKQIFNLLVTHMLDGSISWKQLQAMTRKSKMIEAVIEEVRNELTELLESIKGMKK